MKYLSQFLIIMGFTLAGEVLQKLIPLPVPASVYGIALLFLALNFKLVKLEQVKDVGGFLSSILPLLFVPPAVSILENWGMIKSSLVPILLLVLASTVITFAISGKITQILMQKGEKRHG